MNQTIKNISILFYLSIVLAFISGPVYGEHKSVIQEELRSGKAVVLIINSKENQESEQYADWSNYLNDFASKVGDKYTFHKLDTKSLINLIEGAEAYTKAYSMIFMQQGKSTYFYKGPIFEPQVYEFIQLTYAGKPLLKHLSHFAPKEIEIRFKHCLF